MEFSRVIVVILWVSVSVTIVWTVAIIFGVHRQTYDYCKQLLEASGEHCVKKPRFMKVPSILVDERQNPYDTTTGGESTEYEGLSFSILGTDYSHPSALDHTVTLLLTTAMQGYLTLMLHCAELLVNLRRDEKIWRRASSCRGTTSSTNSVNAALLSWETIGLFAFKTVIHWLFGRCVISESKSKFQGGPIDFKMLTSVRIGIGAFALVYLSAVTLSLAGICTLLAFHTPKGAQPSTHGHYESLIELMDQCRVSENRIIWEGGSDAAHGHSISTRSSSDSSVVPKQQLKHGTEKPYRSKTGGLLSHQRHSSGCTE